tara:strand:+ start:1112 stop:1828 length:717 start_codon:yes stop_codon:yes gene_type:complete
MTDKKPPPKCDFNFSEDIPPPREDDIEMIIDDETGEENPNFIYNDENEPPSPEPIVKETIVEKDIFDGIPQRENTEKPMKQKKPRKPMTEEHKAKLALAREKAMTSRKANALERKKMKDLENEEKELIKTQKIKRVKKLKAEVMSDEEEQVIKEVVKPVNKSYAPSTLGQGGLTRKDLEEAQLEAIIKYEAIRKQRKAEKREKELIESQKTQMLHTIQRATGNTYRYRDGSNRYDGCY